MFNFPSQTIAQFDSGFQLWTVFSFDGSQNGKSLFDSIQSFRIRVDTVAVAAQLLAGSSAVARLVCTSSFTPSRPESKPTRESTRESVDCSFSRTQED
ncbi:MAG: hypothetical protein R3D26_18030 [Cyanobacteriota/Melainabacteria group bacterium]